MNAEGVARCILGYNGIINIGSGEGITIDRFVQELSGEV
jgi:hypothetical protein